MADPSKKPMSASDYIKKQPHLQGKTLSIQNQYSALAEFPPLSYAKAATTEKGQSSTPIQTTTQKANYFLKPQKQHIQTTRYAKPVTLKELQTLTKNLFYENSLYPTDNLTKDRTFYEYILVDSESAEITHYQDKTNPNLISYSTFKIKRIASHKDLGCINLHTERPFTNPGYHLPGYSYTDYQNAFFRTLFLRPYDHSWFISLDRKCPKGIPGWFSEWWYWFGPEDHIYPDSILKSAFPYYKKFLTQQYSDPLPKICFHIDMGIPWICSWHFNITQHLPNMPHSLVKEFRVKWWDKYDLNRCSLSNIQQFWQISQQVSKTIKIVSKSIPLVTPDQFTSTTMQQPSPSKVVKHTQQSSPAKPAASIQQSSPTHSTGSSSSKKSSKKTNIKLMLELLQKQMESSDDEEMPDTQDTDPYGGPLSQDPNIM